jgi:hypothetical protein
MAENARFYVENSGHELPDTEDEHKTAQCQETNKILFTLITT